MPSLLTLTFSAMEKQACRLRLVLQRLMAMASRSKEDIWSNWNFLRVGMDLIAKNAGGLCHTSSSLYDPPSAALIRQQLSVGAWHL